MHAERGDINRASRAFVGAESPLVLSVNLGLVTKGLCAEAEALVAKCDSRVSSIMVLSTVPRACRRGGHRAFERRSVSVMLHSVHSNVGFESNRSLMFYGYHLGNCIDTGQRRLWRSVEKMERDMKVNINKPQLPELATRKHQNQDDEMRDARRDQGLWSW